MQGHGRSSPPTTLAPPFLCRSCERVRQPLLLLRQRRPRALRHPRHAPLPRPRAARDRVGAGEGKAPRLPPPPGPRRPRLCLPSLQASWLQQDLARVDRAATPWVIVGTHVPMYCSAIDEPAPPSAGEAAAPPPPYAGCIADGISVGDRMRKDLEPVLMAGGVDLFAYGHVHAYESTCEWRGRGAALVVATTIRSLLSFESRRSYLQWYGNAAISC